MAKSRRYGSATILQRMEDDFGKAVSDSAKAVMLEYAEKIADTARKLCPVKTGRLRDSIHVEMQRGYARVICDAKDDYGNYYAKIVEFHPDHGQPFMLPAYDEHKKAAADALYDCVHKAIQATNKKK